MVASEVSSRLKKLDYTSRGERNEKGSIGFFVGPVAKKTPKKRQVYAGPITSDHDTRVDARCHDFRETETGIGESPRKNRSRQPNGPPFAARGQSARVK